MAAVFFKRTYNRILLGMTLLILSLAGCIDGGLSFDLRPYKIIQALEDAFWVASVMPENGATGVSVNPTVLAQFRRDMDAASITGATFTLEDEFGPVAGTVAYDAPTRTATFTIIPPAELLYLTEYTVTISPLVRDTEGNFMRKAVQWRFTTMDVAAPTYTVSFNSTGGSAVAPQTIASGGLVTEPANPTRDEYAFEGWYTDNTYTVRWDFSTNTVASDRTLWANWLPGTAGLSYTLLSGTYSVSVGTATGSVVIPETHLGLPVTDIPFQGFYNRPGITSVVIPGSVVSIGGMAFENCVNMGSVTLGEGITTIGLQAFRGCANLSSVVIPESVTSIGNLVFQNCTGLTAVTIGSGVDTISQYAFSGCTNLTGLVIQNTVTAIQTNAFEYSGLTGITIPAGVTYIGQNAFLGCSGLLNIDVDAGNTTYSSISGVLFSFDGGRLIRYPGGRSGSYSVPTGVTMISDLAFAQSAGLTAVVIPNTVTSIGLSAFLGCNGLTTLTIPGSVVTIGNYAFQSCFSITSLTLNIGLQTIGFASFMDCIALPTVTIPSTVTNIGGSAFSGCTSLTDAYVVPFTPPTAGTTMFNACPALTAIHVPTGTSGTYQIAPNWSAYAGIIIE